MCRGQEAEKMATESLDGPFCRVGPLLFRKHELVGNIL
jgi:hypothetical protein